MQVERLALERCVESSGYSRGGEEVRADAGRQGDVVVKSTEVLL